MEKVNIKKLILGKTLPVACTLCLVGCNVNVMKAHAKVREDSVLSKEIENIEDEDFEYNVTCAINDDDVFFEKVSPGEKVFLDDIILTNSERGIKIYKSLSLEKELINNLESYSLNDENKEVIERLNVRVLAEDTLTSPLVTEYVGKHSRTALYMEDSDDLNWNQLFLVLKNNIALQRKMLSKNIEAAKTEEEKEYLQSLEEIRDFSDAELKDWVDQFHEFIIATRKNYKLDMRRLACVLQNYVIGFVPGDETLIGTLAQTGDKDMVYPLFEEYYPNLEEFHQVNYHEFFHLVNTSCCDEKNELGKLFGMGVEYDIDFKIDFGLIYEYFPFQYRFLEEGKAESYSSSLLNTQTITYYDKQFVNNNIELSIFFQPGFEKGNFERASMLHNFIALIQQFPVLDGSSDEEENWFYTQLEMLEAYNVIYDRKHLFDFTYDAYKEDKVNWSDVTSKRVTTLENYADLQLMRNFIWTLMNSKNADRNKLVLEDYYYLMNLFLQRVEMQREIVCLNYDLKTLDTNYYLSEKEKLFNIFQDSLEREFSSIEFKRLGKFEDYNLSGGSLSSAFSSRERSNFYKMFMEMDDYYKWNKEIYDGSRDIKSYYLIP